MYCTPPHPPTTLFDIVTSFFVNEISVLSDHAPIQFTIRANVTNTIFEQQHEVKKLIWDANKVTEFKDTLSNNLDALEKCINVIVCQKLNVDDGVKNFEHTLYNSAFQVFGHVKRFTNIQNTYRKYSIPWFNHYCEVARVELKRANKQFCIHGHNFNRYFFPKYIPIYFKIAYERGLKILVLLTTVSLVLRANRSTVDCIFILKAISNKQISRKRNIYCAFIDFRKAFDLFIETESGSNYAR